jgi:hypothetical protein
LFALGFLCLLRHALRILLPAVIGEPLLVFGNPELEVLGHGVEVVLDV